MKVSLAVHIVGLVMWMGGLMILTRCMKVLTHSFSSEAEEGISQFRQLVKKLFRGFVLPGMFLSLLSGAYQLWNGGLKLYMAQGWFHAKLTVVLALFLVTFLLAQDVKKAVSGGTLSAKRLLILHAVSASSLLLIVLLTMVFR